MLKKNLLILGLLALFISCSNLISDPLNNDGISFSLGEKVASNITEKVTTNNSVTDDSEISVLCEILNIKGKACQDFSKTLLLKDLSKLKINFDSVPYNKYSVSLKIYFNNVVIFEGISEQFIINKDNRNVDIKLNIKQHNSKIEYELNGGQFAEKELTQSEYFFDSTAKLPSPKCNGFKFMGWYTNKEFTGEPITELGQKNFIGDVKLYAKWDISNCVIKYKTEICSTVTDKKVKYGYMLVQEDLPNNLTKTGYKFEGWYDGERKYNVGDKVLGNLTLTEKWRDIIVPGYVYNVTGTLSEDSTSLSLSWINPSDLDLSKIVISCSDPSIKDIEVPDTNTCNITGLTSGKSYTFTLKAVDTSGNKSVGSTIICANNAIFIPNDVPKTSGEFIYFGEWPQTIKDVDVTIDETQKTVDIHGWSCYVGSDKCFYVKEKIMTYVDHDGSNGAERTLKDTECKDDSPKFSDNTTAKEGTTHYFKLEPIEWKVYNSDYCGGKLLSCNKALYTGQFNPSADKGNVYETSQIRPKIKTDFSKAFSEKAKAQLLPNTECFNDTIFVPGDHEFNEHPEIANYGFAIGIRWKWVMSRVPFADWDKIHAGGTGYSNIAVASNNGIICPAIILPK